SPTSDSCLDGLNPGKRLHKHALSAEEVGRDLGINRATAWRYLEQLTELGQAELDMEYGGVGRPTKRYRLRGT
ncbi:HTH domain-containing protein, partial [Deinococcus antarcticus]